MTLNLMTLILVPLCLTLFMLVAGIVVDTWKGERNGKPRSTNRSSRQSSGRRGRQAAGPGAIEHPWTANTFSCSTAQS